MRENKGENWRKGSEREIVGEVGRERGQDDGEKSIG